jgi:hypothetical protein
MSSIMCITYDIADPGPVPRGTNGFFNYGKLAFTWKLGDNTTRTGATHWLEHKNGIIWPEALDPTGYVALAKVGVKVSYRVWAPPIDIAADIQAGIYLGNLLKASPALLTTAAKSLPAVVP